MFQLLQNSYNVLRGKSTTIQFRLTVPFGCKLFSGNVLDCSLGVELTSPGHLTCSQGMYSLDMCGKEVKNKLWNQTHSISVKHKTDIQRQLIKTFEIHLKSKVRLGGNSFWDNVEVPTIYASTLFLPIQLFTIPWIWYEILKTWYGRNLLNTDSYWWRRKYLEGSKVLCPKWSTHEKFHGRVSIPNINSIRQERNNRSLFSNCYQPIILFSFRGYENQIDGTFTLYRFVDEDGNTNEVMSHFRLSFWLISRKQIYWTVTPLHL